MKILYFGWVKSKIGIGGETIDLPPDVKIVSDLITFLCSRGPSHESALGNISQIRVAVDQEIGTVDSPISKAEEVALFPPMTGG